ncbi:unnamed protein product [Hermetia illucens]|uniref:Uncharacterized protein n=1 Tax=Hermetia illucens TaxID=343691 RepID=A0A7R8YSR6_HERIL|nr:unnamed protein product [Hermetia illucens]
MLALQPPGSWVNVIHKNQSVCPAVEAKVKLPAHCNLRDLADPDYEIPGNIHVLIGADAYGLFVLPEFIPCIPCVLKTKLGWVSVEPTYTRSPNPDFITLQRNQQTNYFRSFGNSRKFQ